MLELDLSPDRSNTTELVTNLIFRTLIGGWRRLASVFICIQTY